MKFQKAGFICFSVIASFLSSLQSENRVNLDDPQVIKQQTEDVQALLAIVDPWKDAVEKYSQKNNTDLEIKCKNCAEGVLSLGEFDGCLLAWITKAIPDGHDAFEKVKMLVAEFIKLLSNDASSGELINFMLNTSNDMKEVCTHCHGVVWEKISAVRFSAKKEPSELAYVALSINELLYYFDAMLQFYTELIAFSQKYNTTYPEITCKFCPKRSLLCDELILKVQAKAMRKAIGAEASIANEARKKMLAICHDMTEWLCVGSLDDIREFMVQVAQEEAIPCEGCQRVEWSVAAVSKCAK